MGDSPLAINVDQLTNSVNNAVSGGFLSSFPSIPPPLSASGLPGVPPVSMTGLHLPVSQSSDAFPTWIQTPLPSSSAAFRTFPTTCATMSTSAANPDASHENESGPGSGTNGTNNNSRNASNINNGFLLPSTTTLPLSHPVSMAGCPPMFIMFSLRMPGQDLGPDGVKERSANAVPSGVNPRMPPFPPPFPMLFPILPLQDGRHPRPLLPYSDISSSVSITSSQASLPLPPVSLHQGAFPFPPLPLQLPSSLPFPPILPQSPSVSVSCSNLPLPPLLPQLPIPVSHGDLCFPPLIPQSSASLAQSHFPVPPLLSNTTISETQNSFPLPRFPPQSFTPFVQSGLPMTSLSPSCLPLPPPLTHNPMLLDDENIELPLLSSHCESQASESSPHSSSSMRCYFTTPSSVSIPFTSVVQNSFSQLPPLQLQNRVSSSLHLPPSSSTSLPPPPLSSPIISRSPTPNTLLFSLAGQHMLPPPPPLPGQLFPPIHFMSAGVPSFLGQLPRNMQSETCAITRVDNPEDRQNDNGVKAQNNDDEKSRSPCIMPTLSRGDQNEHDNTLSNVDVSASSRCHKCADHLTDHFEGDVECQSSSLKSRDESPSDLSVCPESNVSVLSVSQDNSGNCNYMSSDTSSTDSDLERKTAQQSNISVTESSETDSAQSINLPETSSISTTHYCESNRAHQTNSSHGRVSGQQHQLSSPPVHTFPRFCEAGETHALLSHGLEPMLSSVTSRDEQTSAQILLDHIPVFVQSFEENSSPISLPSLPVHPGNLMIQSNSSQRFCEQNNVPRSVQENLAPIPSLGNIYTQLTAVGTGRDSSHTVMQCSDLEGSNEKSCCTYAHLDQENILNVCRYDVSQHLQPVSNRKMVLHSLSLPTKSNEQTLEALNRSMETLPCQRQQSQANTMMNQLASACEIVHCSLQDQAAENQVSRSHSALLPSLSTDDHALSHLSSTLTSLPQAKNYNSDLITSAPTGLDISTSGMRNDTSFPFQNNLPSQFNFSTSCTSPSVGQQEQGLLPSVAYSPPGLSNQDLPPNLFSPVGLNCTGQSAVVKDQHLDMGAPSGSGSNFGLSNISVLDMLLKADLPDVRCEEEMRKSSDPTDPEMTHGPVAKRQTDPVTNLVPVFQGHYCLDCNTLYNQPCQHHTAQHKHIHDMPVLTRARATLPSCLILGTSKVVGHFNTTGVFAKEKLQARTEFGPLQGKLISNTDASAESDSFNRWKIFYEGFVQVMDISNEDISNWLMFVKPARNAIERNLVAFQRGEDIVFVTCKDVEVDTELLFWFASDYYKMLGLSNKRQTVSSQYCPYCPVCSYVFFDHKQLKKHTSQQHREANIARWQCNLCALRYRSSAKLNVHLLAHHMHLKPYACQTCGKEFSDASNLRMHKSLHIGVKKFRCDVCGQHFMQKAHLQSHQGTHSGIKAAQCDYCGKRFTRTSDLRQHEFQHTKEKTWDCERCDKKFHRPALLRRHLKVHNNEKNYMCERCSKTFYTKYHLTRHGGSCKGKTKQPPLSSSSTTITSVSRVLSNNSVDLVSAALTSSSSTALMAMCGETSVLPDSAHASEY